MGPLVTPNPESLVSTTANRYGAVVVGAGVAGLVATKTLIETSHTVVCLEARDRVGGRAHSVAAPGGLIDLGATWFWPGEHLVPTLSSSLGIRIFGQETAGDALFEAGGHVRRLARNPVDVPAFRFESGAQSLPARLADELPEGTVRLNAAVHAVHVDATGVRVDTRSGSFAADHVIISIPPALAVDAIAFTPELPGDLHQLATTTQVWMGGVVKAIAVYDQPFWRGRGLAGAAISYDGPFQEIHDHSGPDDCPAALFGFAPARAFVGQSSATIGTRFRTQLRRLFGPDADQTRAVEVADWSVERFTVPTRTLPTASTKTYGHPVFQRATHGCIHWASTETATANAGHLEGAIIAGLDAARSIQTFHPTTIGAD